MKVFEQTETIEPKSVHFEDGKRAMIVEYATDNSVDSGFFIRLQSWDEDTKQHTFLQSLVGKKVKISIEIVD